MASLNIGYSVMFSGCQIIEVHCFSGLGITCLPVCVDSLQTDYAVTFCGYPHVSGFRTSGLHVF